MKITVRFVPVLVIAMLVLLGVPAGSAQQPTLRVEPALILADISPGARETFTLKVSSSDAMNIRVAAQGLGQTLDGQFQIVDQNGDKNPYTARGYIKVTPPAFHLGPGASKDVRVTVNVPRDAGEGGRYAIVNVKGEPGEIEDLSQEDGSVGVGASIGSSVVVTLAGTVQSKSGDITAVSVKDVVSGLPMELSATLKNTGNYHYGNSPHRIYSGATIKDPAGRAITASTNPLTDLSLVPSFSRQFNLSLSPAETLSPGRYEVEVEMGLEDGTVLGRRIEFINLLEPYVLGTTQGPSSGSSDLILVFGAFTVGSVAAGGGAYMIARRRRLATDSW